MLLCMSYVSTVADNVLHYYYLKASASAAGPLRFSELRGCETSGFTMVWDPQDGRYCGPPVVLASVLGALGGG